MSIPYYPTDWSAQCEALCRKTGKQCPHRCASQIPTSIAGHMVMDADYFQVAGRPVRLCVGHSRSFDARAKRLLALPLIDGGNLSPYNEHGYGSVVVAEDRVDFKNGKVTIPEKWGAIGMAGKVPEKFHKLPKHEIPQKGKPG